MVILITGARAPVAIDWARIALQSGHRVWLADSLRRPIGRYLSAIEGYLSLPSPKADLNAYTQTLNKLLIRHQIELVIPTCEEIFYLAAVRDSLHTQVHWWMPETTLLGCLHNKYTSMHLLNGIGAIRAPDTRLCTHPDAIRSDPHTIVKPVYSRFGRQIIRQPRAGCLTSEQISPIRPWVQQQKITGRAICNYAIFEHGQLIAHQAYLPKYCFNQSAASYFDPHNDHRLAEFVQQFGLKTGFHGQAAFDFIEDAHRQLYVLECNPRATSGLHLLTSALQLDHHGHLILRHPPSAQAGRIGATLPLFFGISALRQRQCRRLLRDYHRARDVLQDHAYPLKKRAPWLAWYELVCRMLRFHLPLTDVSTCDIEWDGPTSPPSSPQENHDTSC